MSSKQKVEPSGADPRASLRFEIGFGRIGIEVRHFTLLPAPRRYTSSQGEPGTGGTMTTEEIRLHPCWRLATHVLKRRGWRGMELGTQSDGETIQALHEVVLILSR